MVISRTGILDHVKAVLTAQSRATRCIMGSCPGAGACFAHMTRHWRQLMEGGPAGKTHLNIGIR